MVNDKFIAGGGLSINTMLMKRDIDLVLDFLAKNEIGPTEFARRIGVPPQNFNNWKSRGIPKDQLATCAAALRISVDELLGVASPPPRRVQMSDERLKAAILTIQKSIGASAVDHEFLTKAVSSVDKLLVRMRRVGIPAEAKAKIYLAVYEELFRDNKIAEKEVAEIVKRLLTNPNVKDDDS